MKVVIEQSGYDLLNFGDEAMLQFTIEQVAERWPKAEIYVLTRTVESLLRKFPNTKPLLTSGRNPLTTRGWLFGRMTPKIPGLDRKVRRSMPLTAERIMYTKAKLKKKNLPELEEFRRVVASADCVIASGGGYITDAFPEMVEGVCGTLSMAQSRGKPTAMFGQGLGPLEKEELIGYAKDTMPKVKVLGLREPVMSPGVASMLGVPADSTIVTGDNATILVYREQRNTMGDAIGINVRVARYAGVGDEELAWLRQEVKEIAAATGAPLVPILISVHERDDLQSEELCPPDHPVVKSPMEAPVDTIRAVGTCRVVVTGSYHGAVFALGQGIPVIGLARSAYYVAKFRGLEGLYPSAVRVFQLDENSEPGSLRDMVLELYEQAPSMRDEIMGISEGIVKRSHEVCARFFDLVSA